MSEKEQTADLPEEKEYRYQILYGSTFNPPFASAHINAKNLDDVKEKIKPNILVGAFVVLRENVPEIDPNS